MLRPDVQKPLAEAVWYSPANRKVKLAPKYTARLYNTEAKLARRPPLGRRSMSEAGGAAAVRLARLSKSFDGIKRAVDGVDLAIEAGEFFALLGPSGCGKTTTLRMIAGFETPDEGRIHVGGADVTDVPVHRRNLGMIFQSYALFPHRTVAENVAFGLRMRGLPRRDIADAVARALKQVALAGYEERRPAQLSGGEQQRGALAGGLVGRPPAAPLGGGAEGGGAGGAARGAAAGPVVRRAARGARPQAAPIDAVRVEAIAEGPRRHLGLRHPRPGG